MNTVVAEFEKVSRETYDKFIEESGFDKSKFVDYDDIKIPARSTKGSAGYDFYSGMEYDYLDDSVVRKCYDVMYEARKCVELLISNYSINFLNGRHILIPTFIKCNMNFTPVYNDSNWVLILAPKSGIGSKTGMRLSNTIGIIDSDYYNNPDNEGHILLDITYDPISYGSEKHLIEGEQIYTFYGRPSLVVEKNQKLVQGFFVPFGTAANDRENKNFVERTGGFGSTGLN